MQIFRDEKFSKKPPREINALNNSLHDSYIAYREMRILSGEEISSQNNTVPPSWRLFGKKQNRNFDEVNSLQSASCLYNQNSLNIAFDQKPYKCPHDKNIIRPIGKPTSGMQCKNEANYKLFCNGPYARNADCPYKRPYPYNPGYNPPFCPNQSQNPNDETIYNPVMPPFPMIPKIMRPCGYFAHEYQSEFMDSEKMEVGNVEFNKVSEDNVGLKLKENSVDKIIIPETARYEIHYSLTTSSSTLNGANTKLLANGEDVPLSEMTLCSGVSDNTMILKLSKDDELSLFVDTVVSLVKGINSSITMVAL